MALFRSILEKFKQFKPGEIMNDELKAQVETVRELEENVRRMESQEIDLERREKVMQQKNNFLIGEIDKIKKERAKVIEAAALGEIEEVQNS